MVGGAVHQRHTELPFQTLQPLAQRGLHDVLAGGGPTEMQLLGKGDEIAQLPKLHVGRPDQYCRGVTPARSIFAGRGTPRTPSHGRATVSLIIRADERCTCWSFRPTRAGSSLDTTTWARSQTERTTNATRAAPPQSRRRHAPVRAHSRPCLRRAVRHLVSTVSGT